jgi:NDP-sugar pyrophosphorylase family protein
LNVDALVLAAGKSTRIAPLAGDVPKPLLPIGGHSLIEWNLLWLAASGVESAWINLHYQADSIRTALGDGSSYGLRLHYSLEESILGTAGAWKHLEREWQRTCLVIYGDNLMRFDLASFLETHRALGAPATVALFDPARHQSTGIAGGHAVVAAGARVTRFVEAQSPPSESDAGAESWLVNAGAYLLEPHLAERMQNGFLDFGRDVLPQLAASGDLVAHVMEDAGFCLGLDTPERYAIAERMVNGAEVLL